MPSISRHSRLCIRKAAFCTVFYAVGGGILLNHTSWSGAGLSILLLALLTLPWFSAVYILGGRISARFSRYESKRPSDQEISESLKLQFVHLGRLIGGLVLGFIAITFSRLVFVVPLFIAYLINRPIPH